MMVHIDEVYHPFQFDIIDLWLIWALVLFIYASAGVRFAPQNALLDSSALPYAQFAQINHSWISSKLQFPG